jgi:DNA-binding response OmpR family regulator
MTVSERAPTKACNLHGQSILIVEDEPLIALDLANSFQEAGALVITATALWQANALVEKDGLSAAVLDHALGEENSDALCERLKRRGIPFLIYSGYSDVSEHCKEAPHVAKPASPTVLVHTVGKLIRETAQSKS